MMKRAALVFVLGLCLLPVAHGNQQLITTQVRHVLSPIDSLPTRQELVHPMVFGDDALNSLVQIALDPTLDDPGLRIRAIRALPQFCPTPCTGLVRTTLVSILEGTPSSDHSGLTLLKLRAAIEALGVAKSGDPDDVSVIAPFLDNQSRDVRAAAARALRDLCDPAGLPPLQARYMVETMSGVPQVVKAITEATSTLQQCSN